MSNALAIAAVTATLRNLLTQGVTLVPDLAIRSSRRTFPTLLATAERPQTRSISFSIRPCPMPHGAMRIRPE